MKPIKILKYLKNNIFLYLPIITIVSVLTFIGCKKTQENPINNNKTEIVAEDLAKDEIFIKLNDAINRFDLKYLQLVYKDVRNTSELIAGVNDVMIAFKTNSEDITNQQRMADFYHFISIDELKEYSTLISNSLMALDEKFDFKKTLFNNDGGKLYYEARKIYAKNKNQQNSNTPIVKKVSGIWLDFVEKYLSEFDYLNYVSDESLEEMGDGGGGSEGCTESCCFERETCRSNAKSKYAANLWTYGLGGAITFGGAGFATGTAVPIWGNITGAVAGAIWGGSVGAITANSVYLNDVQACNSTYKACILKKFGF